jgi:hypothetical protein
MDDLKALVVYDQQGHIERIGILQGSVAHQKAMETKNKKARVFNVEDVPRSANTHYIKNPSGNPTLHERATIKPAVKKHGREVVLSGLPSVCWISWRGQSQQV